MTDGRLRVLLRPNHKLFADKYLQTGKISDSAREAGFSERSAHVTGNKLLKRSDVQQYLREQGAKLAKVDEDLGSRVIGEMTDMAFANIKDLIRIDDEGIPHLDLSDATEEQMKAVTSIATKSRSTTGKDGAVTTENEARLGFADKYRGLELLGKHLGLFKADEQRVVHDMADRLLAARGRLGSEYDDQGGGGAGV